MRSVVIRECNRVLNLARSKYGVELKSVDIRFDLKGAAAAQAIKKFNGQNILRFNAEMLSRSSDHIIKDSVPHEIAHLVCFENKGYGSAHNAGWARVCRSLGGSGKRTHNEDVIYAKGDTYRYWFDAENSTTVSSRVHKRIQAGVVYISNENKTRITKDLKHELIAKSGILISQRKNKMNEKNTAMPQEDNAIVSQPVESVPAPAAEPAQKVVSKRGPRSGSNAARVRERIAQAIANDENADVVAQWAIDTLGMKKYDAKYYAKYYWPQVEAKLSMSASESASQPEVQPETTPVATETASFEVALP